MGEGQTPTAGYNPLSAVSSSVYGSQSTPRFQAGPFESDAAPQGPYESDEKAINRPPMVQELNSPIIAQELNSPPPMHMAMIGLPERSETHELGASSTRDRNAGEARVRRSYLHSWSSSPAETPDKG